MPITKMLPALMAWAAFKGISPNVKLKTDAPVSRAALSWSSNELPVVRGSDAEDTSNSAKYGATDLTAKVVIYEAFIEGRLEAPKHFPRSVHELYFEPKYEEFRPRTIWSLSNAFTSAFKELDPIPQFKATAKLGGFLEDRFSQSF